MFIFRMRDSKIISEELLGGRARARSAFRSDGKLRVSRTRDCGIILAQCGFNNAAGRAPLQLRV